MTPTKDVYTTTVEILNQEIDCEGNTPSYYRMLVNKQHFKYITIEPKIYGADDLCFPPILLSKLPPFPAGDWNYGRISQTAENPTPFFAETSRKAFPSIAPLWHAKSYDHLSLKIGQRLRANVYMASSQQFEKPIIAKFARFGWEIGYYTAETQVYSWIDGRNIGPEFLGYLTEEGRVIGFLIEHVGGHHATISDLPACKAVVERLHSLVILHRDLNKHNFSISERGAVLIDFETAERSEDSEAMETEMKGLEGQLLDESGSGGVILDEEEKET
jgi:predicted Ser/Thr protein kinase